MAWPWPRRVPMVRFGCGIPGPGVRFSPYSAPELGYGLRDSFMGMSGRSELCALGRVVLRRQQTGIGMQRQYHSALGPGHGQRNSLLAEARGWCQFRGLVPRWEDVGIGRWK